MHKSSNHSVDGLQQQRAISGATPVSQEQDSEAIMGIDSPTVDS